MALITTISGSTSNSYVTAGEASAYFESHPYATAWDDDENKLIYAATMLDALGAWNGYKTSPEQSREFPRVGLSDKTNAYPPNYDTGMSIMGAGILDTVIPPEIKIAQMELALYFSQNTSVLPDSVTMSRIDVGPIRLDMNAFKAGQQDALPPLVSLVIQKYGKTRSTGSPIFQARVTR